MTGDQGGGKGWKRDFEKSLERIERSFEKHSNGEVKKEFLLWICALQP